jgi:hypothetical protein
LDYRLLPYKYRANRARDIYQINDIYPTLADTALQARPIIQQPKQMTIFNETKALDLFYSLKAVKLL